MIKREDLLLFVPLVLGLLIIAAVFGVSIYVAGAALDDISSSGGLRPLVNEIWCGKKDCEGVE